MLRNSLIISAEKENALENEVRDDITYSDIQMSHCPQQPIKRSGGNIGVVSFFCFYRSFWGGVQSYCVRLSLVLFKYM